MLECDKRLGALPKKGNEMVKHAYIRGNMVWVRGSVQGKQLRVSTGKKADKSSLAWAERNWFSLIADKIVADEPKQKKGYTKNFVKFANESISSGNSTRKAQTNKEYQGIFKRWIEPFFSGKTFDDINFLYIKNWQNTLLEKMSVKRYLNVRLLLNMVLADAVEMDLIDKNPFDSRKLKRPTIKMPEILLLSFTEVKDVLAVCDKATKAIFQIAFFTGMRTGELIALQWDDVDFEKNTISIKRRIRNGVVDEPKTSSSRRSVEMLPVVKQSLLFLKEHKRHDSRVFVNQFKKPYYSGAPFGKLWKKTLKEVGLKPRRFYETRHSFATMMLKNGEDVMWVSAMLGYKDKAMTLNRYTSNIRDDNQVRGNFSSELIA